MGLTWPRLLPTTSEWPERHLSCLTQAKPVINKRLGSTGLKSMVHGPNKFWWSPPEWRRLVCSCVAPVFIENTFERCNGWKMSAERLVIQALNVTSHLYETMKKKWQSAEDTIEQLKRTLQRRNNQVKELSGIVHKLHMTTSQHQRRIELQRHQLEEQEGMLLELYVALQMRGSCPHSLAAQELGLRLKHTSKEYWLLRKHRRNLERVTKPIIQSLIKLSHAAGLVSSSIGSCALDCPSQDHDCTEEFYKALQATVSKRPEAFTQFLEILRDNSDSPLCQQLCQKMWMEAAPN